MSNQVERSTGTVEWNPANQVKKQSTGVFRNVFVGSVSGAGAVLLIQPMLLLKAFAQASEEEAKKLAEGKAKKTTNLFDRLRQLSRREFYTQKLAVGKAKATNLYDHLRQVGVRGLYKGGGVFAASFAPTIACQTAANGLFLKYCDPFSASVLAGMTSAVFVTPAESTMVHQQRTGATFRQAAKEMYKANGLGGFYRGLVLTMLREGAFSAMYLHFADAAKKEVRGFGYTGFLAQGVAVGAVAAVGAAVSHPCDTLKTRAQWNLTSKTSMWKELFEPGLFKGLGWRLNAIVVAVTVMPVVQNRLNTQLDQHFE